MIREITRTVLDRVTAVSDSEQENIQLMDPASSIEEKIEEMKLILKLYNVEDLHRMKPPIKRLVEAGRLFGVQEDQGGLRTSMITLENDKLYLHCLLNQHPPPNAHTLPVCEVMGTLDPSTTLVFLDLSWPGSSGGRVHIRLSPDTSKARQFVLLCTGQRGYSYRNTVLFSVVNKGQPGERVKGGDYEDNSGEGGATLLPHPIHQYRKSKKAGTVMCNRNQIGKSAQFSITTKMKDDRVCNNVIGEVESGLEVVRAAANSSDIMQVTVVDCGVVVSL